jgi:ribosomal-protein-alanine N-acetyltransferase
MWQTFPAPFTPALEVGWRLAAHAWGHGYATEAGNASLQHAFDAIKVDEVVSMTSVSNTPSRAVMERLGMTRDPDDDFDHPRVPDGSPLRRHVLYRLSRRQWSATVAPA